ncbi:hypothetical protein [Scytonema sp. NUACC26]|uniref:hypothetical protein n=1 Tax=Scytonema sp. NUACC26 TaxID=3140176 RepID=UPI0034DBAA5D
MAIIQQFLTEKLQAKIAEKLIDDTTFRRQQRSGTIWQFMPIQTYNTEDFVYYVTETVNAVASIVAKGAPIPTSGYGGFGKINVNALRVGKGHLFDTLAQEQMQKVMNEAMYKGVGVISGVDPGTGKIISVNDALVNYLFGSVKSVVNGVMDKFQQMAVESVAYGSVTLNNDPLTKGTAVLNFRETEQPYDALHFPATLTDTGNTADRRLNRWTDYANADGIGMIEQMCLDYVDTNGFLPDAIWMSNRACVHLRNQEATIHKARQAAGLAQVGSVGVAMLKEIMSNNNLPPIVTAGADETYDVETTTPTTTNTRSNFVNRARFLNENRIVFLKEGVGELGMGITMEMRNIKQEDGRISNENSAVMVRVYEKSKIPMSDEIVSLAAGCPIVPIARRMAARTVF